VGSHIKAPQWVLMKGLQHFPQDQKVKMDSRPPKTLAKPYKYTPQDKKKGEA